MSGAQRISHMQTELDEVQTQKTQVQTKIKQLTIEEKKNAQALARYIKEEERNAMNGASITAQSAVLHNELRVWREKVQKLQAQKERDETARRNQAANIETVQNENRQIVEQIRQQRMRSPTEDKSIEQ